MKKNEPRNVIAAKICRCDGLEPFEFSKECVPHRVGYARQLERFYRRIDPIYYKNYI